MGLLVQSVLRLPSPNLFLRPLRGPLHHVVPNPVMRLAGEGPVPDRRVQRHRLTVEDQFPIGRRKRRDHLLAATAATSVNDGCVLHGNIECPVFQLLRRARDELMRELRR